jgi:hypothetical protein
MFARRVAMQLKPNAAAQFTQKLEEDILPLLRKQKGFQDELTFISPSGAKAFAISLWDRSESAEAYGRETYPQVVKILSELIEGTPKVFAYLVSNSTFHKIEAPVLTRSR